VAGPGSTAAALAAVVGSTAMASSAATVAAAGARNAGAPICTA
jgi:hypothetical protein